MVRQVFYCFLASHRNCNTSISTEGQCKRNNLSLIDKVNSKEKGKIDRSESRVMSIAEENGKESPGGE